jgi:hypothetical protein
MPSRLRFDSDVSEVAYDVDVTSDESTEVRWQKVALSKKDDSTSTQALFRVGSQVLLDPPRSMKATNEWQQLMSDASNLNDDAVRGIVVALRSMMLQSDELGELEDAECQAEDLNYVYGILLHDPLKDADVRTPKQGDKVTLRLGATMKFVGGVLKSRGCPEGAPPTFPVGVVLGEDSLQATCPMACLRDKVRQSSTKQVKVRLYDSNEFSWYNKEDLQIIEDWERKFKEGVPEDWLRDMKASFRSQIENMCLEELLQSCPTHRIPVFQRRYCWTRLQWMDLWRDLTRMRGAGPDVPNHSLGRLLLRQRNDGSRLILDGQQRLTTISLLLSALRDRLGSLGEEHEVEALEALCGGDHLIPTLDDRADFHRCLNEAIPEGDGGLLEAKRLYTSYCEDLCKEACIELVTTVRRRFSFMVFILQSDQRLQVIYHAMSKGWGSEGTTAGIEMSPVDFIRNFVLEHFSDEQVMRKMHAQYWSPLEAELGSVESMEHFFENFLTLRGFRTHRAELYDSFEAWWKSGIQSQQLVLEEYAATKLAELRQAPH